MQQFSDKIYIFMPESHTTSKNLAMIHEVTPLQDHPDLGAWVS